MRSRLLFARPPALPVHDVDYTADFAFVGDPLFGMGVGEQGQILKFNADGQSHDPGGRHRSCHVREHVKRLLLRCSVRDGCPYQS